MVQAPGISHECPWVQHFFLYRKPRKNIMSYVAIFSSQISAATHYDGNFIDMAFFPLSGTDSPYHELSIRALEQQKQSIDLDILMTHHWAQLIGFYSSLNANLPNGFPSLLYEDLLENPAKEIQALLESLHMPSDDETLARCLKAMDRDSQRGSVVSKDRVVKRSFSESKVKKMNAILRSYDLEVMGK